MSTPPLFSSWGACQNKTYLQHKSWSDTDRYSVITDIVRFDNTLQPTDIEKLSNERISQSVQAVCNGSLNPRCLQSFTLLPKPPETWKEAERLAAIALVKDLTGISDAEINTLSNQRLYAILESTCQFRVMSLAERMLPGDLNTNPLAWSNEDVSAVVATVVKMTSAPVAYISGLDRFKLASMLDTLKMDARPQRCYSASAAFSEIPVDPKAWTPQNRDSAIALIAKIDPSGPSSTAMHRMSNKQLALDIAQICASTQYAADIYKNGSCSDLVRLLSMTAPESWTPELRATAIKAILSWTVSVPKVQLDNWNNAELLSKAVNACQKRARCETYMVGGDNQGSRLLSLIDANNLNKQADRLTTEDRQFIKVAINSLNPLKRPAYLDSISDSKLKSQLSMECNEGEATQCAPPSEASGCTATGYYDCQGSGNSSDAVCINTTTGARTTRLFGERCQETTNATVDACPTAFVSDVGCRGLPPGPYLDSCQNCKRVTKLTGCKCYNASTGKTVNSKDFDISSCTYWGAIQNKDGQLACPVDDGTGPIDCFNSGMHRVPGDYNDTCTGCQKVDVITGCICDSKPGRNPSPLPDFDLTKCENRTGIVYKPSAEYLDAGLHCPSWEAPTPIKCPPVKDWCSASAGIGSDVKSLDLDCTGRGKPLDKLCLGLNENALWLSNYDVPSGSSCSVASDVYASVGRQCKNVCQALSQALSGSQDSSRLTSLIDTDPSLWTSPDTTFALSALQYLTPLPGMGRKTKEELRGLLAAFCTPYGNASYAPLQPPAVVGAFDGPHQTGPRLDLPFGAYVFSLDSTFSSIPIRVRSISTSPGSNAIVWVFRGQLLNGNAEVTRDARDFDPPGFSIYVARYDPATFMFPTQDASTFWPVLVGGRDNQGGKYSYHFGEGSHTANISNISYLTAFGCGTTIDLYLSNGIHTTSYIYPSRPWDLGRSFYSLGIVRMNVTFNKGDFSVAGPNKTRIPTTPWCEFHFYAGIGYGDQEWIFRNITYPGQRVPTYRGLGGGWDPLNDTMSSFKLIPSPGATCSITLYDTDDYQGRSVTFTSRPGEPIENAWLGPSNPQMNGMDFNDCVSSHIITISPDIIL